MAKTTLPKFPLSSKYKRWLKKNGVRESSLKSYFNMKPQMYKNNVLYYDIISSFLLNNDIVYAYTILDDWQDRIRTDYNKQKIILKTFQNRMSYLAKFKQFISSLDLHNLNRRNIEKSGVDDLDAIKESFNKPDLHRIDAMDSLITVMGGEKAFIKLAIESSFFFNSIAAKERHSQIASFINDFNSDGVHSDKKKYGLFENDGDALPVRKSQKTGKSKTGNEGSHEQIDDGPIYYYDENGNPICPISKDGNGNARVCQLLNKHFGYNFALKGKVKPFKNFIISHIWGRAIDPRYFTNLWNIVIVPAWANHLLDKDAEEGSLASKFKATIMNICIQHYEFAKLNWKDAKMSEPTIKNEKDILKGKYLINVISKLDDGYTSDKYAGSIISEECIVE